MPVNPDPKQSKRHAAVPEQRVDGHFFPRDALPQHVVGEGRQAKQRLQDGVHVASVAQVGEAAIQVTNNTALRQVKGFNPRGSTNTTVCNQLKQLETVRLCPSCLRVVARSCSPLGCSYPCRGGCGWANVEGLCLFQPP